MARAKSAEGLPTLFGGRIPVLTDVVVGIPVGVRNSSEATFALSPDGRRWVRKRELVTGYEQLASEALGFGRVRKMI